MKFDYQIKSISFNEFVSFLRQVEQDFVPPLLDRIDVEIYYKKVSTYATLIACYLGDELIGLSISYDNNMESKKGFVTFIAVNSRYRGNGIASHLLDIACDHAKKQGMDYMGIETNNIVAKECYIKNNFKLIEHHRLENLTLERYYLERTL